MHGATLLCSTHFMEPFLYAALFLLRIVRPPSACAIYERKAPKAPNRQEGRRACPLIPESQFGVKTKNAAKSAS